MVENEEKKRKKILLIFFSLRYYFFSFTKNINSVFLNGKQEVERIANWMEEHRMQKFWRLRHNNDSILKIRQNHYLYLLRNDEISSSAFFFFSLSVESVAPRFWNKNNSKWNFITILFILSEWCFLHLLSFFFFFPHL